MKSELEKSKRIVRNAFEKVNTSMVNTTSELTGNTDNTDITVTNTTSDNLINTNNLNNDAYTVELFKIMDKNTDIFGVDTIRVKIPSNKKFKLNNSEGHIITVIYGKGVLKINSISDTLTTEKGSHMFIPLNENAEFESKSEDFELVVLSASKENVTGKKFLIKNNLFLKISTSEDTLLRWITTPQYLSRRVFLHHESTLVSKIGFPVSWNNTTMFDCTGLPLNDVGLPVFRMSYNNNTEINCCYDVPITSKVRYAKHPYKTNTNNTDNNNNTVKQEWSDWADIDSNTTYSLVETAEQAEIITETLEITETKDKDNGISKDNNNSSTTTVTKAHRNKHEIFIPEKSYVSLCCMFDPGITGIEKHIKGQYSDYVPVSETIKTQSYKDYLQILTQVDIMIESLSLDYALGKDIKKNEYYEAFKNGLEKQKEIENQLMLTNPERVEAMKLFSVEAEMKSMTI